MPLKVTIKLGENTFVADGDFEFNPQFEAALARWINAQGTPVAGQLETLTGQLEDHNKSLETAVAGARASGEVRANT